MTYSVLIIGLGQIGMEYDYDLDCNSEELILTHAQAVSTNRDLDLSAGVDSRLEQREKFSKKFRRPAYASVSDALSKAFYDVVVIAASTNSHLALCKTVISLSKPKLILLEKPLAYSSRDSFEIIELSRVSGVPVAVNYFRAYEPEFLKLGKQLRDGRFGFPLTVIVRYSNGMVNNGSHWVQFISSFLGTIQDVRISSITRAPSLDFSGEIKLSFSKGLAYFIPFDEIGYYLFDIDIFGPIGKVSINSSGKDIREYHVEPDRAFKDLKILSENPQHRAPNIDQYQKYIYGEIVEKLRKGTELSCSSESLRTTVEIYSQLESQLRD